jgi:hypothetical protein
MLAAVSSICVDMYLKGTGNLLSTASEKTYDLAEGKSKRKIMLLFFLAN